MYDAIGGLLGRLVLPLLCDLFRVARGAAVAFSLATLSACLAALTFFTSHPAVASIVVAASLPTGFLLAMKPVLIGDYFGVKMFAATWGLTGTCTVPLLLVNPVITGFFRDTIGSFDYLYRIYSALNLLAGIVLLSYVCMEKISVACCNKCRE
ncbi:uncharacterized protein LOC144121943 [Amblyomma americanum]